MRRFLIVLVLASLAAPAAAGWTRAGLYGADVRSLVIDPKRPDVLYLGTSGGEVYVSQDGAVSWQNPRGSVPFPGHVVDSLILDSQGRLWAACWGLWGGGVIAVSGDGGISWSRRDAGLEEFSVRAIAVDPGNADTVVVGGLTGVYRSRDGGKNWKKISDQINVESLAIDPRTADRIYVGTWRQAFRTEDGGKKWKLIDTGMVLDTDVFSITIDSLNPDSLWVSTCGWVYNSPDRGSSWTRFKEGFNNRRIHDIEIDPQDSRSILAGSVAGLYRSSNVGKSWERISDEGMVINSIGLHPERPNRIILATEGDGIYISCDNGKTYARSNIGLYNVRVASVVPDPEQKRLLYAAVYSAGSASGVYRSSDQGLNWAKLNETRLPEIRSLLVRADTQPRFLAGTEKGFFWSRDGVEWTQAEPSTSPIRVEKILAYNNLRTFAATSEGVFTSRDSGKSWYRLGGSSSRSIDIAVGRLGENRALYALTAEGLMVFDGESWSAISKSPSKGRTLAIRESAGIETIVVAGTAGVKAGHVDFRKLWNPVAAPVVAQAAVYEAVRPGGKSVFLSSRQQDRLFIADDASSWRSIKLPTSVTDVGDVVSDPFDHSRLFVATGGEGIFIYNATLAPVAATAAD
ncbi:MAG TPA: YCF48-related protein [Thermoanaerobaculia bacterium]|nr:YCF48-related protein [Thermoanaerobaculia bacterium]